MATTHMHLGDKIVQVTLSPEDLIDGDPEPQWVYQLDGGTLNGKLLEIDLSAIVEVPTGSIERGLHRINDCVNHAVTAGAPTRIKAHPRMRQLLCRTRVQYKAGVTLEEAVKSDEDSTLNSVAPE